MAEIREKTIVFERKFKAGYIIRHEMIDGADFGCEDFVMKSAYTHDGAYIGDTKSAWRLCVKRGIKPEMAKSEHGTCSIGFSSRDQKWYGWSHRALYGFEVGTKTEKGDCAYVPEAHAEMWNNVKWTYEAEPEAERGEVYHDPHVRDVKKIETLEELIVTGERAFQNYASVPKPNGELIPTDITWEAFEDHYPLGKGEWVATTLQDAKQMAIDFAESVS